MNGMFNTIFSKGSVPVLENILYFTAERHKVIANNIVNADTPGFTMMDVPEKDFQNALSKALKDADERAVPTVIFEGSSRVKPKPGGGLEMQIMNITGQTYMKHDGNNVDIDLEMAKLAKNSALHNAAATLLNHQFTGIREAISERILA